MHGTSGCWAAAPLAQGAHSKAWAPSTHRLCRLGHRRLGREMTSYSVLLLTSLETGNGRQTRGKERIGERRGARKGAQGAYE